MRTLHQDQSEFNVLFVRAEIDDYGLTANQFRIYAHLARRAGANGAWPSVKSMANHCLMNEDTIRRCLKRLKELNLIHAMERSGATTVYTLTSRSQWKAIRPINDPSEKRGAPLVSESTPPETRDGRGRKRGETKESHEGYPLKDNTVGRQSDVQEASLPPQTVSQESLFIPDGRPPNGEPAMNGQNVQGDPVHDSIQSSQSLIQRKAYAVAERLQFLHWDNSKIFFVKQTAKAYAEKALQDGHDEQVILKAYETALRYCHRVITDEICRGKRHQSEKASPALTVWLARERLSGDPGTVDQRWKVIAEKLTAEKRKVIEEDTKVRQEVAEKAPEISTWFANHLNQDATGANPTTLFKVEHETVTA